MPGGHQAIIGLPDILRTFLYVFVEMLEDASEMLQQEDDEEKELFLNAMGMEELKELYPDLVEPWSEPIDEIAPEETEAPDPCSFTGPLYYLSKPHEEVIKDYFEMFEKHISEEWRANPKLMELMHSDIALEVFVPAKWHGLNIPSITIRQQITYRFLTKSRPET
jgi:hypothetical protein